MQVAANAVWPHLQRDRVDAGSEPSLDPATWAGRVDQQHLVALDVHVLDLERRSVPEPLEQDVVQEVFLVRVEHVGQSIFVHPDVAGQQELLAVGDEVDVTDRMDGER